MVACGGGQRRREREALDGEFGLSSGCGRGIIIECGMDASLWGARNGDETSPDRKKGAWALTLTRDTDEMETTAVDQGAAMTRNGM